MKKVFLLILICSTILFWSNSALSVPLLQLDIEGGYYVGAPEETVFASGNQFSLYALAEPNGQKNPGSTYSFDLNDVFYISAALIPKTNVGGNLGSFTFDYSGYTGDTTIDVTGDMNYGIPGLPPPPGSNQLPPHGVFATYYKEFAFKFDPNQRADIYNSQNDPGGLAGGLNPNPSGPLYYFEFSVDVSGLIDPMAYSIHFDLYTKDADGAIIEFAPFSHDAQSGYPGPPIPEPTTILLIGLGLLGIAGFRKKLRK